MTFPEYWFTGTLNSMGWPRKEGGFLRKRLVVDSNVADRTLDLLIYTGILLGADAPSIGRCLLVSQFDERELWMDKSGLETFTSLLNEAASEPYLQSNSDVFAGAGLKVPWKALGDKSVLHVITTRFISALWLGLTKPQQVSERIDTTGVSQYEDEMYGAGLKGSAHSRKEMVQATVEIVTAYEIEREELRECPSPLSTYINEQRSSEKA